MSPPWVWHVKRTLGVAGCQYESTALLVDDDSIIPKWTWCCHPNDEGTPAENRVRLALALGSCTWVCVHLLRPWFVRLWRRLRRRC